MILLTVEEIIALHAKLISKTGGSEGIRDRGLLESAVNSIYSGFGDTELYPSVEEKAARLAYGLISNHSFIDGNKRIGVMAMLITLRLNSVTIKYCQSGLIDLALSVASGQKSYDDILHWLKQHDS